MKKLIILFLFLVIAAFAQTLPSALNPPTFLQDVYTVSPYTNPATGQGISGPMNPMYYATVETAVALAQRFGAVPVQQSMGLTRFGLVELTKDQLAVRPLPVQAYMSLPEVKSFVLKFPSGCTSWYAGYYANFYRLMPPSQFPGLADHYALINLQADCPADNVQIR